MKLVCGWYLHCSQLGYTWLHCAQLNNSLMMMMNRLTVKMMMIHKVRSRWELAQTAAITADTQQSPHYKPSNNFTKIKSVKKWALFWTWQLLRWMYSTHDASKLGLIHIYVGLTNNWAVLNLLQSCQMTDWWNIANIWVAARYCYHLGQPTGTARHKDTTHILIVPGHVKSFRLMRQQS